jgi:hypothetical protein
METNAWFKITIQFTVETEDKKGNLKHKKEKKDYLIFGTDPKNVQEKFFEIGLYDNIDESDVRIISIVKTNIFLVIP